MTQRSPDYIKRLVAIKGACAAPSATKGDPVSLGGGGKARNVAEKDLATKLVNDVKGVKNVTNFMTVEYSK